MKPNPQPGDAMPELVLFIAASLDGLIAGPNGEIDWLFTDQDYGYTPFIEGVDRLVMGRKTHDQLVKFGDWHFGERRAWVFTRWPNAVSPLPVEFVRETPGPFVRELKRQPGKSIWLLGGGQLTAEMLREDLVDRIILTVHPLLLGSGAPLFPNPFPRRDFTLEKSESFSTGLVQLTYGRRV